MEATYTRGPLPAEAIEVEQLVGLFDSERGSGTLWSAEEFNAFAPRALPEEEMRKIRAARGALLREWSAVAPGGKMELEF